MVCLGNICRSPMAHGIMERIVKENDLGWEIESAGTGDWHVGEPPDPRAIKTAAKHGIDISGQVCRLFQISDFDTYDYIFTMDRNNLNDLLAIARDQEDVKKIKLLLGDKIVPDPYYSDKQFEPVFKLIEAGCRKLVGKLMLIAQA